MKKRLQTIFREGTMKKLCLLLALCLAFTGCLFGCGKSGEEESGAAQEDAKGEVVDVGEFTVVVPEGWMKYPQTDVFGEADADGNTPLRTDAYGMIKDGKSEIDAFSKPTVYVYYYDEAGAEEQASFNTAFYDENTPIELTVNGQAVIANESKMDDWAYQVVFIPITENSCFQVTIPLDIDGVGTSYEDADVMTIMESLQVK